MIKEDILKNIVIKINKNPNYIYELTDSELLSYESYLIYKIRKNKKTISMQKKYCQELLNKK